MTNNFPHYADDAAIPGSAPGGATKEELASDVDLVVTDSPIQVAGQKLLNTSDWHRTSTTDTVTSTKYAKSPTTSYYAGGALGIEPRKGTFVLSKSSNEPGQEVLKADAHDSQLYSTSNKTVVGSLNISTLDGYEVNPLSSSIPSTPFSPVKPWWKKLFPDFASREFVTIVLLEAAMVLLLEAIEDVPRGTTRQTSEKIDLGTIIINNQELEDKWFGPRT